MQVNERQSEAHPRLIERPFYAGQGNGLAMPNARRGEARPAMKSPV